MSNLGLSRCISQQKCWFSCECGVCVMCEYVSYAVGHRVTSLWLPGSHYLARTNRDTNKWKLHTHIYTLAKYAQPQPLLLTHTELKTSLSRSSCPIAHTVVQCAHLCIHQLTEVELIKRFSEGSQERRATVGSERHLILWRRQTQDATEVTELTEVKLYVSKLRLSETDRSQSGGPTMFWLSEFLS